jgi:lysophospholipase L1-like esterase
MEAVMRTDDHYIAKHSSFLNLPNKYEIQVIMIGDSITRRWEDNIDLWNKFFSKYRAANFGVGGDCLENIKWRILNGELDGVDPKIVILLAGTNNLDTDSSDAIIGSIKEIAEIIQQKLKNTKVVVLGILPRNFNGTGINYPRKISQINKVLASIFAGTEIEFRDIGKDLANEHGVVSDTIMPDGLHLDHNGYEVFGPKVKAIIDEFWLLM